MTTVGYALVYWGIHHFPIVDGGNRVSLFDCLGVPQAWQLIRGQPVQFNFGSGNVAAPPNTQAPVGTEKGIGKLGSKAPAAGGKPAAAGCWKLVGAAKGLVWQNTTTGAKHTGLMPPGKICSVGSVGTPNPIDKTNCWVLVMMPNFQGPAWRNRKTGQTLFQLNAPGPVCPPSGPNKPA